MNEAKKTTEPKKLETVKKELLKRKKELEEQLKDFLRDQQPPDQTQDIGDQAQSLSIETLKLSLQDAELHEYNMINKALEMIESGTYGMCVECGNPISEKRLKLYPNATRCLSCQEMAEEKGKEL